MRLLTGATRKWGFIKPDPNSYMDNVYDNDDDVYNLKYCSP